MILAHLDVICQFGHVLDDVAVFFWLHLQQLLDHYHRLGNDQFCAPAWKYLLAVLLQNSYLVCWNTANTVKQRFSTGGSRYIWLKTILQYFIKTFSSNIGSFSAGNFMIRQKKKTPNTDPESPLLGHRKTHRRGLRAAAPGRSDTCPSPPRCWWHSGRWPGWWRRQSLCPCSWCRSAGRTAKCQVSAEASALTKAAVKPVTSVPETPWGWWRCLSRWPGWWGPPAKRKRTQEEFKDRFRTTWHQPWWKLSSSWSATIGPSSQHHSLNSWFVW